MAKYIITHKCGHEVEVELFGKGTERERRIKRMEAEECPECRAKHATERDLAKGYAALEGSPKQVAWASDIREWMFGQMAQDIHHTVIPEIDAYRGDDIEDVRELWDGEIIQVINGLSAETSAKWLIEHRNARFARELVDRYLD